MNYVLVDYENVQPDSFFALDTEHLKVFVFLGEKQSKIAVDAAISLQPLGTKVEFVRIAGMGSNALDFHIAFYIGQLAARDDSASFQIISKDTGFDPLIRHLKGRKISALRSEKIQNIPPAAIQSVKSLAEQVNAIVANLHGRKLSKPGTLKTLTSTIAAVFRKQLTEGELSTLLTELQTRHIVIVDGKKVSYQLPTIDQ